MIYDTCWCLSYRTVGYEFYDQIWTKCSLESITVLFKTATAINEATMLLMKWILMCWQSRPKRWQNVRCTLLVSSLFFLAVVVIVNDDITVHVCNLCWIVSRHVCKCVYVWVSRMFGVKLFVYVKKYYNWVTFRELSSNLRCMCKPL